MENLITKEYFYGLLELPYILVHGDIGTPSGDIGQEERTKLDAAIAYHQAIYMIKMLGTNTPPSDVIALLKDEPSKTSPIACYVFCQLCAEYQTSLTPSGETMKEIDNATSESVYEKYMIVWNRMVEMNRAIYAHMSTIDTMKPYVMNNKALTSIKSFA